VSAALEQRRHGPDCACLRCTGFPRTHGAFAKLTDEDRAEVEEIVREIEAAAPDLHDSDRWAVEGMARTVWRSRRMTAFLSEHGFVRDGEARSLLRHVDSAERIVQGWADRLGLSTASRFELGLRDAQRRALHHRTFDMEKLSADQRARARQLAEELEAIVADAEVEADA
jgi:hypothetical protein